MKLRLVPYSRVSEGCKALADELDKLLPYKVWRGAPKPGFLNLAWGGTQHGIEAPQSQTAIRVAVNKLTCFQAMEKGGVNIPRYTTERDTAAKWNTVCARTILSGSEGRGLVLVHVKDGEQLPNAPLYVEYKPKRKEFRVHVFGDMVLDVQEKRMRRGGDANAQIRNHQNGWVFCHEDIQEPKDLRDQARLAVKSCGLLFGAVDIIWNEKENKSYVLEINTSPGLSPTTASRYAKGIVEWLQQNYPEALVKSGQKHTSTTTSKKKNPPKSNSRPLKRQ